MFRLAATRGKTKERREEKITDKEIKEISDKEKVKSGRNRGRGSEGGVLGFLPAQALGLPLNFLCRRGFAVSQGRCWELVLTVGWGWW